MGEAGFQEICAVHNIPLEPFEASSYIPLMLRCNKMRVSQTARRQRRGSIEQDEPLSPATRPCSFGVKA